MKRVISLTILNLAIVLASGLANAALKPIGTFVPTMCNPRPALVQDAQDVSEVEIASVCIGQKSGLDQEAIRIEFSNGSVQTFDVSITGKLRGMGAANATVVGHDEKDEQITIKGILHQSSGIIAMNRLQFQTSTGLSFDSLLKGVFQAM